MPIQFEHAYDRNDNTQTFENSNSHSFLQFDKKR